MAPLTEHTLETLRVNWVTDTRHASPLDESRTDRATSAREHGRIDVERRSVARVAAERRLRGGEVDDQFLSDHAAEEFDRAATDIRFLTLFPMLSPTGVGAAGVRDVLAFNAAETTETMAASVDAVDALLRRARTGLDAAGIALDDVVEPEDAVVQRLLGRYADAFERADTDALAALVCADVQFEMPPRPMWFTGRDAVVGFLANPVLRRLLPRRRRSSPLLRAAGRHVARRARRAHHGVQRLDAGARVRRTGRARCRCDLITCRRRARRGCGPRTGMVHARDSQVRPVSPDTCRCRGSRWR